MKWIVIIAFSRDQIKSNFRTIMFHYLIKKTTFIHSKFFRINFFSIKWKKNLKLVCFFFEPIKNLNLKSLFLTHIIRCMIRWRNKYDAENQNISRSVK